MVMIPNAPRMGDMPAGEPVPEGIYHLRLDKATFKTTGASSKHPGTPMAEVQFTIFGPEDAEEFHGRKIFENLMLAGEGMFRTRQLLEATGEDEDFILEDTDQLLQREVAAVVQVEKEKPDPRPGKQGQMVSARNRIARFQSIEQTVGA
jgi:hypothetical protein